MEPIDSIGRPTRKVEIFVNTISGCAEQNALSYLLTNYSTENGSKLVGFHVLRTAFEGKTLVVRKCDPCALCSTLLSHLPDFIRKTVTFSRSPKECISFSQMMDNKLLDHESTIIFSEAPKWPWYDQFIFNMKKENCRCLIGAFKLLTDD